MLCTYSTSAALSAAYNLGALAGILYAVQLSSGVLIAMSYVASEDAYSALDGCSHYSVRHSLCVCILRAWLSGTLALQESM